MIRKILGLFILFSNVIYGQESTSSPYSYFHTGLRKYQNTIENKSMGELNVYADSIHLNLVNPASLSKLGLTTYTIGASHYFTNLSTNTNRAETQTTNFDYIAVGLPIAKKLGVSFGLSPYSVVGYDLRNTRLTTDPNNSQTITRIESASWFGEGNLNKVFISAGLEVYKNLSVGASFNYFFGRLTHNYALNDTNVSFQANEEKNSDLNGLNATLGLYHFAKVNKKLTLHSSLTYTPKTTLTDNYTNEIFLSLNNTTSAIETPIEVKASQKIDLPSVLNFGLAIGEEKKWLLGGEFTSKQAPINSFRFNALNNVTFETANKFNVGGYFIPKYNSFSSYWSRVTYRAGFRYENLGFKVQNQSITDIGINFGLGIPLKRSSSAFVNFSNINVNFEYGQRGTRNANLIKEDYFSMSLSISFNDKWFEKRKYN
jgi:hypothetical protein